MDKSHYQQIQTLIEQNPTITGFDLYYLGFFAHYVPKFTLQEIFTHIANIIRLHNDQLITNDEKIEFLMRMLSKKIDFNLLKNLAPQTSNFGNEATKFLDDYFHQILKILPQFPNVSKFELFYLGRFHAICPSYQIAEMFRHINNINKLVAQDLIDEETQVDFLLKILNKQIMSRNAEDTRLNIPLSPLQNQDKPQNLNLNASPNQMVNTQESTAFKSETDRRFITPVKSQMSLKSRTGERDESEEEEEEKKESLIPEVQKNLIMEQPGLENDQEEYEQKNNREERDEESEDQNREREGMEVEEGGEGGDLNESEEGERENFEERNVMGNSAGSNNKETGYGSQNEGQRYQSPKQKIFKQFSFQNSIASGDDKNSRKEVSFGVEDQRMGMTSPDIEEDENHNGNANEVREDEEQGRNNNQDLVQEDKFSEGYAEEEGEKGMEEEHAEKTNEDFGEDNKEGEVSEGSESVGDHTPKSVIFQKDNKVQIFVDDAGKQTDEDEEEDQKQNQQQQQSSRVLDNEEEEEQEEVQETRDNKPQLKNLQSFEEEEEEETEIRENNEVVSPENVEVHNQEGAMIVENEEEKNNNEENAEEELEEQIQPQEPRNQNPDPSLSMEEEHFPSVPYHTQADAGKNNAAEAEREVIASSQSDQQTEVKKLMAQLYPESHNKPKNNNTLDDILNSLLDSEDGKSEASQRVPGRSNSIMASLASQKDGGLGKDGISGSQDQAITSGQVHVQESEFPVPKNYKREQKLYEASLEIIDEARNSLSPSHNAGQDNVRESKEGESITESQVRESATLEDITPLSSQPNVTDYYQGLQKLSINESQSSRPDASSLILKWRGANKPIEQSQTSDHPHREQLLKQVVQEIANMGNIEIKQEETESRVLDANTQADPTQENEHDNISDKMASLITRTPNDKDDEQIDPSLRVCSTVKQTLSQMKLATIEDTQEDPSNANSAMPSQHEGHMAVTLSQRKNYNELYPSQPSKFSSSSPGSGNVMNTLDEINLARKELEELEMERERERQRREKGEKKVIILEEEVLSAGKKKGGDMEVENAEEAEEKEEQAMTAHFPSVHEEEKEEREEREEPQAVTPPIVENMIVEKKKSEKEKSQQVSVVEAQEQVVNNIVLKERMVEEVKVETRVEKKNASKEKSQEGSEEVKINTKPMIQETRPRIIDLAKCSICVSPLVDKQTVVIEACGHRFHKDCLEEYLNKKIDEKTVPVTCPRQECGHSLLLVDLMDLVDAERQEKFVTTTLRTCIEMSADVCCCPTPGCQFAFLKTYRSSRFRCSLCKKTYCMSCHAEWHRGMSCEEYRESQKQEGEDESSLVGKKTKQCPTCQHWVGKKQGSNKMQCRCGNSFCYCCGKPLVQETCACRQESEQRPIVQPDLFHRAMQSPQEYRVFSNKGENGRTVFSETFNAGGGTGESGHAYRGSVQEGNI